MRRRHVLISLVLLQIVSSHVGTDVWAASSRGGGDSDGGARPVTFHLRKVSPGCSDSAHG